MAPVLGIWASSFNSRTFQPTGSYDALATYTVPSGGVSSITFAGLPTGGQYTHLQLRFIARNDTGVSGLYFQFNNDSSSSYSYHRLVGNGSAASANGSATQTYGQILSQSGIPSATSTFAASIIDILDYANTSKYKTVRSLSGYDGNGSGGIAFESDSYQKTNAINSIFIANNTNNFAQYSQFSLYGVKG